MDPDNTEQHNNHVQRDDGDEQDDENPQNRRDERQEHSCAVEHDAEERHEQDEAEDGSNHMRDRNRRRGQLVVSRRDRAVFHVPAAEYAPSGQRGGNE